MLSENKSVQNSERVSRGISHFRQDNVLWNDREAKNAWGDKREKVRFSKASAFLAEIETGHEDDRDYDSSLARFLSPFSRVEIRRNF